MKKEIKDYFHLYYGCEFRSIEMYDEEYITRRIDMINPKAHEVWKPTLRPLSDMTEEERKEVEFKREILYDIHERNSKDPDTLIMCGDITKYLLKQGFDLFGLIEAGLAIDKTTLNP